MLILVFFRNYNNLLQGKKLFGHTIYNLTVGIIGLGNIGSNIADILYYGFKCNILYHATRDKNLSKFKYVSLEDIFKKSDIVIVAVKGDFPKINRKFFFKE